MEEIAVAGRKQFTFYGSYLDAIMHIKDEKTRCEAFEAVCKYGIKGEVPDFDSISDMAAIIFDLVRPTLDTGARKSASGRAGGRAKQNEKAKANFDDNKAVESKAEANESKVEAKKSKMEAEVVVEEANGSKNDFSASEIEKEVEVEIEKESLRISSPDGDDTRSSASVAPSAAVAYYANRVNPMASSMCLSELETFERAMGTDVCKRAIDTAIDERKTTWSYVRGILRAKQAQGVKCLADWDKLEEKRETGGQENVVKREYIKPPDLPGALYRP
nr:MAG TPA: Putative primosome component [Caudoviricetes sp.]